MMFLHRNIHKYVWTTPYGKTRKQIDHILIDRKWHLSTLNVRSFRGADKLITVQLLQTLQKDWQ